MLTEIQIMILFFCFTIGAILRTLWGFLWKYLEDQRDFDSKYIKTMIVSIVVTFIFAVTTFSTLTIPDEWAPMLAFTFITTGFTANSLINDIVTFMTKKNNRGTNSMDNEDGDGNPGEITPELCLSYRKHLETKIGQLSYTIKITGAVVAIVLAVIQLGLYFWG